VKSSIILPFVDWTPDLAPIEGPGLFDILNVYPIGNGYRPFQSIGAFTDALTARCQGAFAAKDDSANAANFAGDATKLYRLGSDNNWDDVSRSASAYATGVDEYWSFAQFGSNIIAVNGFDAPQKFVVGTSTEFEALAGSPPTARYIAVVRDFVLLGNLSTSAAKVQWSAFNNSEGWTIGVDQSDEQEFPDGGWVQGVVGGEVGYVIQERSIRRLTYVGGDIIFQIDEVEKLRGTRAPKSIVQVGGTFFYLGQDGFYWFTGEGSKPVGAEKVDRWFYENVDQGYLYRVVGAADPSRRVVVWAFPSAGTIDGTPDTIIGYRWDIDRWFRISASVDYIHQATTQGYTLEGLDAVSSSIDTLQASLDSSLWVGGALGLAAFGPSFKMGYFDGENMAATLSTQEKTLAGGKIAKISNSMPVVDTDLATVSLGLRDRAADSVSYTDEAPMETTGYCSVRGTGRFCSARVSIPAGADWKYAQAVQVEARPVGVR
jgi:hypothetical protein